MISNLLKFSLLSFGILTLTSAQGVVRPNGTIMTSSCGQNIAPSQERNRFITRVCLAQVEGVNGVTLITIQSENRRRQQYPLQVLPVITRGNNPAIRLIPGHKHEILTLGTNEVLGRGSYPRYVSRTAKLHSEEPLNTRVGSVQVAKTISGEDLSGMAFEVDRLESMSHTQ